MSILIACITFGHASADVLRAMAPAISLADRDAEISVIVIDDCSGKPPILSGIKTLEMKTRVGFPAVVNQILESTYPEISRLVLINPDALIEQAALKALIYDPGELVVPTIANGLNLENVRPVTRASWEFLNLLFGEKRRFNEMPTSKVNQFLSCPPFAPSGAVVAIDAQVLRETPLRPEMFWLEFSDLLLRRELMGLNTKLTVLPDLAEHLGASTSLSFPLSVAASQMRAKVSYIRSYGNVVLRALLPLAVFSKAMRVGIKLKSFTVVAFAFKAAFDVEDWRVNE